MATALDHGPITVSDRDAEDVKRFARVMEPLLQGAVPHYVRLVGANEETLAIPEPIYELLRQAIPLLAKGNAVALIPSHKELTTQQAADILNVSRPFLVTLLENGTIPFTKTGTHRRICFNDMLAYMKQRDAERREKLTCLTQMSQELGLYDRR